MNSLLRHFFTTCCLLGILPISAFAQIPRTFSTVGTATLNNPATGCNTGVSNCFELTPNTSTQIGAIWDNTQLNLSQNFDISFCLNFGTDDAGADGIVFVLQQAGLGAVGGAGGGQGYLGIANPSLGVEFDIFDNTATLGDIADDHIAINANGVLAAPLAAPAAMFGAGVNAEDGNFHTFRVLWNAQCQTMSIYADGVLRNTLTNDIVTNIFGGNANVFWGFTASTGGATNQQQVCINGFRTGKLVNIGNDTTLCSTQSVNLDATIANATAYLWSTGATTATITAQGVNPYVVSVTVGGCVVADTMFISACQTDLCNRNQGNIWYFGFSGAGLDFNTSPPTVLTNGQVNTFEGVSTMADLNGNLLFYTDGITVWDRTHTIMTNGTGLFGDPSSAQSGVIVPHPARSNIYYVFTTDVTSGSNGCRYSVVDMNLRGGLGDVLSTEKNVLLFTNHTEKLTAIKHCNGRDYWVATHEFGNNNYRVYLVDNNGLNTTPLIQAIGSPHSGAAANQLAYMRFSVDGSKMAATIFASNTVEIFDFNNSTGVFSNPITLTSALWAQTYGVEFSADARLLYISGLSAPARIHQVDLSSNNAATILASATQIARSPGQYMYGALQLAPDGRIYVCRGNGGGVAVTQRNQFLAVINNPSNIGTACNYQDSAINLINGRGYLGLPNFIQSSFASPAPSLQGVSLIGNPRLDTTCTLPQTLTYSIERPTGCGLDSIRWSLNGTVLTAFTDTFATININTTGSYDLVVNVYTACQSGTDTLTILSTNPPTSVALGNDTILCQNATLTLTAPAGFAGYLWQDGSTNSTFTVTATGNYSVTASTLCGQTYQDAISVQYSSITLTAATATDVSCPSGANGTVRSTPSNGIAPYRYLWSNGQTGAIATGLLPNNYCVTVSDLGNCTATVCQSVTQLPAATVSTSPDTAICLRDSASLRVNGAFSVTTKGMVLRLSHKGSWLQTEGLSLAIPVLQVLMFSITRCRF
jgi:Bacterial lectin/SprB repeat